MVWQIVCKVLGYVKPIFIMLYNIIITYYIYCVSLIIVILKSDMKKKHYISKNYVV